MFSPTPDALIEMFRLDWRKQGAGVLYVTNNARPGGVIWGGVRYTSSPIEVQDLSVAAMGTAPVVAVSVSNLEGIFTPTLIATNDFVGGTITRFVVNVNNLDDGTDPSPNPVQPPDVFIINESQRNQSEIFLNCTTQLSVYNAEIPSKRMLRRDYPGLSRVY